MHYKVPCLATGRELPTQPAGAILSLTVTILVHRIFCLCLMSVFVVSGGHLLLPDRTGSGRLEMTDTESLSVSTVNHYYNMLNLRQNISRLTGQMGVLISLLLKHFTFYCYPVSRNSITTRHSQFSH